MVLDGPGIKDKIDKGEVQVEYKPTERMWADILTKPKQGAGMNVPEEYDDVAERARTNMKVLGKPVAIPQQVKSMIKTMIAKNNPLP